MAHLLRKIALAIAIPLGTQLALSGCAMGGMGDQLPHGLGGLPETSPARPTKPYDYPAVHDMPAERNTQSLDDAEQIRLQRELQNLRDSQEKAAADPDAPPPKTPPKAPTSGKKKAASPKTGQATGAKTNP